VTASPYTAEFFHAFQARSSRSAARVLPIVLDVLKIDSTIDSAVDVGCGIGTWAAELRRLGVGDVIGVDGAYVERTELLIPHETFVARDLSKPLRLGRAFDLAVCMEVGEHLPAAAAAHLVGELTALAPAVLFSAAIPFQGGNQHVNEQWQSYWAELFAECDYVPYDVVRPRVWTVREVEFWYAQNTILYVRRGRPLAAELTAADPRATLFDVVHPGLYDAQHARGDEGGARGPRSTIPLRRALERIARRDG
jgi:SAM-dependent methyltransferase